jgi:hypothetical protein
LQQARSDFAGFEYLSSFDRAAVPECHPLHFFQMSTEKLAKAAFDALGMTTDPYSHVAFSLVPNHLARRDVALALGYRSFHAYRDFLSRAAPLFRRVDELNPAVGQQMPAGGARDGPNVEYPWEARNPGGEPSWIAPSGYNFRLLFQMERKSDAEKLLDFVRRLLNRFESVFPS